MNTEGTCRICGAPPGIECGTGKYAGMRREHERLPYPEAEVVVDADGNESHPSFGAVKVSRVSSTGHYLYDSEIMHREFVTLEILTATRRRDLNHDWHFAGKQIVEVDMSLSQWASMISSFNQGSGTPCTIAYRDGEMIADPPTPDRLAMSVAETKAAAKRMHDGVTEAVAALEEAFASKAGRREMADRLNDVRRLIDQSGGNVAFAAQTLNEHVENVVTKAKADIEGMVARHAETLGLDPGDIQFQLGTGDTDKEGI